MAFSTITIIRGSGTLTISINNYGFRPDEFIKISLEMFYLQNALPSFGSIVGNQATGYYIDNLFSWYDGLFVPPPLPSIVRNFDFSITLDYEIGYPLPGFYVFPYELGYYQWANGVALYYTVPFSFNVYKRFYKVSASCCELDLTKLRNQL